MYLLIFLKNNKIIDLPYSVCSSPSPSSSSARAASLASAARQQASFGIFYLLLNPEHVKLSPDEVITGSAEPLVRDSLHLQSDPEEFVPVRDLPVTIHVVNPSLLYSKLDVTRKMSNM